RRQIGMRGQNVFRHRQTLGAIAHTVLKRRDLDVGRLGLDRLLKSVFAFGGGDTARNRPDDRDLPALGQDFSHALRRQHAALVVVGGNVSQVFVRFDAGIEYGYGDVFLRGALHHGHQRFAVRGSEGNAIHMLIDEIVNDVDLPAEVDLGSGTVPTDLHAQLV